MGINVNDKILRYGVPIIIVSASVVYKPKMLFAKQKLASINIMATAMPNKLLTVKPLQASRSSSAPINCEISIPATVPIAPITTEKISIKFPPNPTAAILFSPSCPIINWSIIENEDCSML